MTPAFVRLAGLTVPAVALALGCGPSKGSDDGGETDTDADTDSDGGTSTDPGGSGTGSGSGGGTDGGLAGFGFRRPISIENPGPDAHTDVEVPVSLEYDTDMVADFSDLRFTDDTGTAEIPFWVESVVDSTSALVWVAVPDLPGEATTTIYVYYGNPNAASASDGPATFHLFDDFEDGALDPMWMASGQAAEADGRLLIETGAVYTGSAIVAQPGLLAEINASWSGAAGIDSGLALHGATSPPDADPDIFYWMSNGGKVRIEDEGAAVLETTGVDCCADPDLASWVGIGMSGTETSFTTNLVAAVTHPQSWTGDLHMVMGHLQGELSGTTDIFDLSVNTAIVRTYLSTPPVVSVGEEEAL